LRDASSFVRVAAILNWIARPTSAWGCLLGSITVHLRITTVMASLHSIAARAAGLSSDSTTIREHLRQRVRSPIIWLTGLPEVVYGSRRAVGPKVGVLRSSYGEQVFSMTNQWPNPYEGVYATAWPCNGKELSQVPGWPPLPHWELFLGRPPFVKRQTNPLSGILATFLC
jgi:hypothetical protein